MKAAAISFHGTVETQKFWNTSESPAHIFRDVMDKLKALNYNQLEAHHPNVDGENPLVKENRLNVIKACQGEWERETRGKEKEAPDCVILNIRTSDCYIQTACKR